LKFIHENLPHVVPVQKRKVYDELFHYSVEADVFGVLENFFYRVAFVINDNQAFFGFGHSVNDDIP